MVAFCGRISALVSGICKCLGANFRGVPGVNPPGWPLISALVNIIVNSRASVEIELKIVVRFSHVPLAREIELPLPRLTT